MSLFAEHEVYGPMRAEAEQTYFLRLGVLFTVWSETESALYKTLVRYAKVSDAVGRSVFAGEHANKMATFVKRIAANTKMPADRSNDLAFLFRQLGVINTMRDWLAHQAPSGTGGVFSESGYTWWTDVNNHGRAKTEQVMASHRMDATMLAQMTEDLRRIQAGLHRHTYDGDRFDPLAGSGDDSTWKYKAAQPTSNPAHAPPNRKRKKPSATS